MAWFKKQIAEVRHLFRTRIWSSESINDKSPRGRAHAFLRVVSITVSGLDENRAVSRAAALSFSSLIGLGPLIALVMMVAGFMLDDDNPDLAVESLNTMIKFVAPQLNEYERVTAEQAIGDFDDASDPGDDAIEVRPELVEFINGFVSSSRNGTVGAVGALTLIIIVLQLFTSIETAFNDIWGVRRGRSWLLRIVFYWTVLSLGAVLFFAALTGLSAGAFLNVFQEIMPFGDTLVEWLKYFLPLGSFTLLVAILAVFYRAIPNTHVFWGSATVGAFLVGVLLISNNYLAFIYISRVLQTKALYGSLAIPIVLMFGLYIFWFFVLLGGQVSYAVQNVRFRNSKAAWNTLAESMRERLSLVVLLTVCRRFHSCQSPQTASELGLAIGVPDQLLNACLDRLVRMHLITPIPAPNGEPATDDRYHPARPLGRTTLAHFKKRDDDLGDDPAGPILAHREPLLAHYNTAVDALTKAELFQRPLDQLFEEHPLPSQEEDGPQSATATV
ncbi:YihY/virulence factor BrkB family protein [Synoicihabitans lomoniglobus]|uniref:YihY/virulence factor BrkB family protein n=1 Tax=Synoicihabitans lomoniglobus TaxID=2909285 RepID=A0AAF0I6J9_9BACT|nr:YihY/virulence factor BrkB family protein [Opitutaceae bacterium LMO-M01]WED66136.1 YihY/virulence factor BrkB family protein [Opitutaceae bacterium LMO-M01]